MQQRRDDTVEHSVFVQLAAEAVDDVQPAITQTTDAQRARGQGVRQFQFGARIERSFHQAVAQRQQLHMGLFQRASCGRNDGGFRGGGSVEDGGMGHGRAIPVTNLMVTE
ncbi:hypothetical protein MKZ87_06635 [Pseudomonas sp. MCal1]|nr:hypothetical protein [Pseudomonas sp. MCal1]UIN53689.1 hypothetical protein LXN51_22455 [Pseudomonas kribbensis]